MLSDIGDALSYCQGKKMIHRDIKPANIFRTFRLTKLGDFGHVKFRETL